jgi:uncharacterized membrane protein YciS (DUF1049 family)
MSGFSNEHKPNLWWIILLLAPFVGMLLESLLKRADLGLASISPSSSHHILGMVVTALITGMLYLNAAPRLQPIRRKQKRQQGR